MVGGERNARNCKDCAYWRPSLFGWWADKCSHPRVWSVGARFCQIERYSDYVGVARVQGTCGAPGWLWLKGEGWRHKARRAVHSWLRARGLTAPAPRGYAEGGFGDGE
jgi:hypothetical protein